MTLFNILFVLFISVVFIQCAYHGYLFSRFAFAKPSQPPLKQIGVSVVIAAKNESQHIENCIQSVLHQDYPKFEIVLINDNSSDDTLQIMSQYAQIHKHIKVIDVKPNDAFHARKKYALTLGIKASTYDFLLFTDADCSPVSDQWIKEMTRHFSNTKSIVIGFGAYRRIQNSFLNQFIRFETVFAAMQYFSYAMSGRPYMAVGRNLAYRKALFFSVNGFSKHMQLPSGDDDLFINEAATSSNLSVCFSKSSMTESEPERTWRDWFQQKRRHIATANHYKTTHQWLLGLFYLSQLLFWILGVTLILLDYKTNIVLILMAIRLLCSYLSYGWSAKKLDAPDTILLFPVLEVFLILSQLVIFSSNLTMKSPSWK